METFPICFCQLDSTSPGRWPPTIETGSAPGFCLLNTFFFFFFFSSLAGAACLWGKRWGTVNNQGVGSIPAQFGKFHKMTFVVNWHYTNKDWLTVETQNRYHQVKPWCFLNHNQEVFVRKPNQSISTASWQERNRTLDPNKSKIVT